MEPGPSGSRSAGYSGGGGGAGGGGGSSHSAPGTPVMSAGTVQQTIMNPIPGPSTRPYLATPVQVPPDFLVPQDQLLPHQVASGIDIGNLFKLLNALQNRIALACSQHQYLRDPQNHPRPPEDGGYKPLTPKAAVRDIRTLCRQQRNLMEKLRRWNCVNEGKCYDLILKKEFEGICANCTPFATSQLRHRDVRKALKKQEARKKRRALKKKKAIAQRKLKKQKQKQKPPVVPKPTATVTASQPVQQPLRKRRKKSLGIVEPPHPESFLSQENFLSELGLVTPEVYQKTQAESRRTERRRRTTANPKYKSGVFVDPNLVGRAKRSRRGDPESLLEPIAPTALPSRTPGAERRKARQKRYECSVCGQREVTVECSKCLSGFHPDCIRVSASMAPPPKTVSVCPNCVSCNPDISASDCILLSRRISRPSIMGLKADPPQQSRLAKPKTATGRNQKAQKATYKRKTAAKAVSKAVKQRKNASPAKPKTQPTSFKQPSQIQTIKPKKTQIGKKASTSKRNNNIINSLNHSLAVAAAAAVPAYCTSLRSSVETAPAQAPEKVRTVTPPPPPPPKQKVIPPVGIKWNKKHSKLRGGNDRRKPFPRRDISSVSPTKDQTEIIGVAKPANVKAVNVKAAQLFPPQGQVSTNEASKPTPKVQLSQPSNEVAKQKSLVPTQSNIAQNQGVKKQPELKTKSNIAAVANEQNHPPPPPTTDSKKSNANITPPNKTATKKKGNGLKPVDPFCMKRTMMAMCAAAGIVMSTNGIKIPGLSQPPPTSSSTTTASQPQSTLPSPTPAGGEQPKATTSCVPTPTSTPIKSNISITPQAASSSNVKSKEQEVKGGFKGAAGNAASAPQPSTSTSPSTSILNVPQSAKKKSPAPKKPATPKQSVAKPATPNQSVPKAAAPKQSVAKPATPKQSVPKPAASKQPLPKPVTLKQSVPNPVTPKAKRVKKSDPNIERSIVKTMEEVIMDAMSGKLEDPTIAELEKAEAKFRLKFPPPPPPSKIIGDVYCPKELEDSEEVDVDVDDDLDKPPVLKEYTKESPADVNLSYSYGTCPSNNDVTRPDSPSSNSSTIGSSRSLSDIVSDDSSDELLSIPDTSYPPYLELKMMGAEPNPLINFETLDRMELLNRKVTQPAISPASAKSKRGRPKGSGRANK